MTTDSPLLPLFKGQLEAECQTIATDNCLTDRGHWLIYWYFQRFFGFSSAEVDEVFCAGGSDLGIDVIWIDDDDVVHFYQFKNPQDPIRGIPAGDIDKTICGLRLIMKQKHDEIANPNLKARVEEIYQKVRAGYRLHLVSSGTGIQRESR